MPAARENSRRSASPRQLSSAPSVETVRLGLSTARPIGVGASVAESVSPQRFDMHYGLELGIVLSGRMRRSYSNWEAELGPGEAWYCGIWERHGWSVVQAPCETVVVTMLPQVLASPEPLESMPHDWLAPFQVPPEHRPRIAPEARQRLLAVGQQLRERRASPSSGTITPMRERG